MSEGLIDLIYDAAADPGFWDNALIGIADSLSATSSIFVGHRSGSWTEPRFGYFGRLDRELNMRGSREDFGESPLMPRIGSLGVGQIAASEAIMPLAEARRTEWYRHMMLPQDIAHCVMAPLQRDQGTFGAFFVARSETAGAFTGAETRRLEGLMPHLRRSAQIHCHVAAYGILARQQQSMLDALDTAIVLIDDDGTARCVNRTADHIFAKGDGLKLRGLSLSATDRGADARLQALIAATAAGGCGATIALPRSDTLEPLMVLVSPLRGQIRESLGGARHGVALFIKDPAPATADMHDVLRQFYGLTCGEARVAAKLAAGLGIGGTAERLDLSENTVKMHAKRIYDKLGVSGQVQLAQFFARHAI